MLVTWHWSATGPSRINDYHVEGAMTGALSGDFLDALRVQGDPTKIDWEQLRAAFTIWKNDDLSTPTDYGTWHLNHDPRDDSANIEIGMLCMLNATTQNWGKYPFTIAHAYMATGIAARIATLKGLDCSASFDPTVEPSVLMNGPIYQFSTHAERALQTQNPAADHAALGYFIFSGDPDCRWDIAVKDPSEVSALSNAATAVAAAKSTAAWMRDATHRIKAGGISDMWGLDKDPS